MRDEPDHQSDRVSELAYREPFRIQETAELNSVAWAKGLGTHYDQPGWVLLADLQPGWQVTPEEWWEEQATDRGREPYDIAADYRGMSYGWGGMGLTSFGIDCSGLVQMALRRAGHTAQIRLGFPVHFPRDAHQQEDAGLRFAIGSVTPRRGDLVTYGTGEKATHIAFFKEPADDQRFVILHAHGHEDVMKVVEGPETDALVQARRLIVRFP